MDKIKRFIDIFVPTETCNLRCNYCYITQNRKFNGKLFNFKYTLEDVKKAFSIDRLGGNCLINFCAGGETLLSPCVVDIIKTLLECGHYVMVVTNGTIKCRFEEMAKFPEDLKRKLFIKFSFHYLELKRLNLLETFFDNAKLMHKSHISITIELAVSDDNIPHKEEIKNICLKEVKALPHVTILRDDRKQGLDLLSKYSMDELSDIWKDFDSELFNFRKNIWGVYRKEFCYAGKWSFCVDIGSGEITKCFSEKIIGNIFEDMDKPIEFECVGNNCKYPYCYAGHAFLALGVIPELDVESFDSLRDRDNAQWLYDDMKSFMHQKLKDNNKEDNIIQKKIINHKIHKEKRQILKDYNYYFLKKIKNDKTTFVDFVEARQELSSIYKNKVPSKYSWIYNYDIARKQIKKGDVIKLIALNKKNEQAQGYEVCIVGIMVDNAWFNANEIFDNVWLKYNNCLIWRNYDVPDNFANEIKGFIPNGKKIKLVVEKNKWRGCFKILFDNKEIYVDAYSADDDEIKFITLK